MAQVSAAPIDGLSIKGDIAVPDANGGAAGIDGITLVLVHLIKLL